jgi:hypothetical protein
MFTHTFTVTVTSKENRETMRNILDSLINIGLSDATDTVNEGNGDVCQADAQIAIDADWTSPV